MVLSGLFFLTLQTLRREFPECTWEIAVRLKEPQGNTFQREGEELKGLFFSFFLLYPKACGILVSQPRIKPRPDRQ